jgi:hypothetical protein
MKRARDVTAKIKIRNAPIVENEKARPGIKAGPVSGVRKLCSVSSNDAGVDDVYPASRGSIISDLYPKRAANILTGVLEKN